MYIIVIDIQSSFDTSQLGQSVQLGFELIAQDCLLTLCKLSLHDKQALQGITGQELDPLYVVLIQPILTTRKET